MSPFEQSTGHAGSFSQALALERLAEETRDPTDTRVGVAPHNADTF